MNAFVYIGVLVMDVFVYLILAIEFDVAQEIVQCV